MGLKKMLGTLVFVPAHTLGAPGHSNQPTREQLNAVVARAVRVSVDANTPRRCGDGTPIAAVCLHPPYVVEDIQQCFRRVRIILNRTLG